jgi:hypothetical protein
MQVLRDELEALAGLMHQGTASSDDVRAVHHLASKMLTDGRRGTYGPALDQINGLLDTITRTMYSQARLERLADGYESG